VDIAKQSPSVLSFCAGYGGIEKGLARIFGDITTLAYVEIEAYAIANLISKMETGQMVPAPIWTDVKTFPVAPFRGKIDILTGGYPCQPFSFAGKRQGSEDPRHLWPFFRSAIDAIRPGLCFLENVEGHITEGLYDVLQDLGNMGYQSTWGIFSAQEVGAPHQRRRVFILAHSPGFRDFRKLSDNDKKNEKKPESKEQHTSQSDEFINANKNELADSVCKQNNGIGGAHQPRWDTLGRNPKTSQSKDRPPCSDGSYGCNQNLADSACNRLEAQRDGTVSTDKKFPMPPSQDQYHWEKPRAIKPGMGGTTYGPSCRVDRLRLLGNGVVPQTAELAFRTLFDELISHQN